MRKALNIQMEDRISVVIPCFNHGKFLATAINSVLKQQYSNTEIIVVDDGSTDDTALVAAGFPSVKYVYQENQGLSAARNCGIAHSTGEFLVFLDADDWLETNAFEINLRYLKPAQDTAFVSGAHFKISANNEIIEEVRNAIPSDHYRCLLEGNYIGMHGTVMYRRWVFDYFRYDTALPACEDYDLYLKITRRFPVKHHTETIAYYLIHGNNMSSDSPMMLQNVLNVLNKQEDLLINEEEIRSLKKGRKIWTEYYSSPGKKTTMNSLRKRVKKYLPDIMRRALFKSGFTKEYIPGRGRIRMGDLLRVKPFSTQFGYDRGGPVDRYYIENFLEKNAHLVRGNVLEIGDNEYTLKYGGDKLIQTDILHIDDKNPKATIIGDLSNAPQVRDNFYDCIILTQTLHLIYDFHAAIQTCYRVLKPGGTLLMTVPGITHIDQGEWKENWLWAFTGSSITKILNPVFSKENVAVETHGNVLAATAFLYGMGLKEVKKKYLDFHDPHYQVIIVSKAVKPI